MHKKGFLITFEGGDGAGKSTLIARVIPYFKQTHGLDIVKFREPGATKIGEQIRSVLHSQENKAMVYEAELLLYLAARAQNVKENIRPTLREGKVILMDRFIDSSVAYQGVGRGLGKEFVETLNHFVTGGLIPDLTLLFDINPEIGIKRREEDEGTELNRLDLEGIAFHTKVRDAYQAMAQEDTIGRFIVIDALRSKESVFAETVEKLEGKLIARGFIERLSISREHQG